MTDEHDHMRWRAHATLNLHTDKSANVLLRCACNCTSICVTFDDRTVCMISTVHSASSSENKNHSRIYGGRFRTKAQHEAKQEETRDTLCTRRGSAATLTVVVGGECVDSVDGGDVEAERVSFTLLNREGTTQQPEITTRRTCTCTYNTTHMWTSSIGFTLWRNLRHIYTCGACDVILP